MLYAYNIVGITTTAAVAAAGTAGVVIAHTHIHPSVDRYYTRRVAFMYYSRDIKTCAEAMFYYSIVESFNYYD